jgi:hypothetical protein
MVKVETLVLTVADMIRLALWFVDDNESRNRWVGKEILGVLMNHRNKERKNDFIEIPLPSGAKIFKVHRSDPARAKAGSYWIAGYSKVPVKDGIVPLEEDVAAYRSWGKIVHIPRGF